MRRLSWLLTAALALGGCYGSDTRPDPDAGDPIDASMRVMDADAGQDSSIPLPLDSGLGDQDAYVEPPDTGVDSGVDSGPPDGDADGVPTAIDCDDADPEVGRAATRTCSNACGEGSESCTDAVWGACDAPTDCACSSEGMTRGVPCGLCGTQRQRCTGGVWTSSGSCLMEGVCMAGTTETRDTGLCVSETRTCSATCQWSDYVADGPRGECVPGQRPCLGGTRFQLCNEDCMWVEDPTCP